MPILNFLRNVSLLGALVTGIAAAPTAGPTTLNTRDGLILNDGDTYSDNGWVTVVDNRYVQKLGSTWNFSSSNKNEIQNICNAFASALANNKPNGASHDGWSFGGYDYNGIGYNQMPWQMSYNMCIGAINYALADGPVETNDVGWSVYTEGYGETLFALWIYPSNA